jgi:hypothetical protein
VFTVEAGSKRRIDAVVALIAGPRAVGGSY